MEAIFHIRPLSREGTPDIHSLLLDDYRDDYTKMGLRIIRHLQEYADDDVEKIELRKHFVTTTIEAQKIPFLCHVQLGDLLCSLDNI